MRRDIRPWLDERELPPGSIWQEVLEEKIDSIKSVAVFVGKHVIGPWQQEEIEGFVQEFTARGCRVMPVILARSRLPVDIPMFLKNRSCVNF